MIPKDRFNCGLPYQVTDIIARFGMRIEENIKVRIMQFLNLLLVVFRRLENERLRL